METAPTDPPGRRISNRQRLTLTLIGVTLLILFGPPLAMRFWPLSATARSLLGTWRPVTAPDEYDRFTFTEDGRFHFRSVGTLSDAIGTWTAADGELALFTAQTPVPLTVNSAEYHLRRYFSGRIHDEAGTYVVTFDDPDRVNLSADGFTTTLERVR